MSRMAYQRHQEGLKALGLVDEKGQPTWFTDGRPDIMKMMDIAGTKAQGIPLSQRAAVERQVFGAQGSGAFSLLTDNAVHTQIQNLMKEMNSPEFKNRYSSFSEDYRGASPVQQFRTTAADFKNVLMDIGATALPFATGALQELDSVLKKLRGVLPEGTKGDSIWRGIGTQALIGAGVGAGVGSFMPGIGTLAGAGIGGITGGVFGVAEQLIKAGQASTTSAPMVDRFGREIITTGNSAAAAAGSMGALAGAIRGLSGAAPGGVFPGGSSAAPMHYTPPPRGGRPAIVHANLTVDGKVLARSTIKTVIHDAQAIHGSVDHDGVGGAPHPASFRI